MRVGEFILEEYVSGWVLKTPCQGKDKGGNPKVSYKNSYHSNLGQCLSYIRDVKAKGCDSVLELITLLEQAESMDLEILSQNGLINTSKRFAA